ncbi:MAG TPA: AI-2E family transporter [Acidimicrobiales bacterium]|nr:AI-2E family transporter [Acidimicrobiales bacterium]
MPSTTSVARTTLIVLAVSGAAFVGLFAFMRLSPIVTLLVIAGFFAVLLSPPVNWLERRAKFPRGLAVMLVFVLALGALSAMTYAFARPLVEQTQQFVTELPTFVEDARDGRGRIGKLVERYNLGRYLENNQERIEQARSDLGKRALPLAGTVASSVAATLTVLVLAILMVLRGPEMQQGFLGIFESDERREQIRRVSSDAATAVTRYMAGNVIISIIAGVATYIFLSIAGVPFKEVLALWVAFADLIPLVGATLGAFPAVMVAFLHGTGAGIATLVFFILYQQFENHVLQVTVMSRTVDLNPLVVLVSVLVGVELFGILGALLAIPTAGIIQVLAREIMEERRRRRLPIGEGPTA